MVEECHELNRIDDREREREQERNLAETNEESEPWTEECDEFSLLHLQFKPHTKKPE